MCRVRRHRQSVERIIGDAVRIDIVEVTEHERLAAGALVDGISILRRYEFPDIAGEAFRLGASAFVLKNSAATELLQAIRQVVRGGYYVTPLMTKDMDGSFVQNFKQRKSKYSLTLRQKEVLQLLAEGLSMKEAAFVLNVSPRTVAFHKYTMMEHLNIRSSAELIEYALKSSVAFA